MDVLTKNLARRIRRLRKLRGLSQCDLATRAQVTAETVARLERRSKTRNSPIYNPSLATLHHLSVALGIDVSDMLARETDTAHWEEQLAWLLDRANPQTVLRIMRVAEVLLVPDAPESSRVGGAGQRRLRSHRRSLGAQAVPNIYRIRTGRLVEVRVERSIQRKSDVTSWFNSVGAVFDTLNFETKPVVVADWRHLGFLSNNLAEYVRSRMMQTNARVERSAALVSTDSDVAAFQLSRLVEESENSQRRTFTQTDALVDWLSEKLSEPEKERLVEFLGEI